MNKTPRVSVANDAESTLYASIRALVESARSTIARGVYLVQVHTNFEIGRHVVEFEQQGAERAEYGQQLLKQLAERLTAEFGNGFSLSNLKLMRQFYMQYAQRIGQTASGFSDGQAPSAISQTLSDLLVAGNGNAPSPSAGPITSSYWASKRQINAASTKSNLPSKTGPCESYVASSKAACMIAWP